MHFGIYMSNIIRNLREKYPHNSIYTIRDQSIDVYRSFELDQSKSVGVLSPGQTIYIEFTIIIPQKVFPDWWVWGALSTPSGQCTSV